MVSDDADELFDGDLSLEEIEAAYQRALETAESAEALLSQAIEIEDVEKPVSNESSNVTAPEISTDDPCNEEKQPIQTVFVSSDQTENDFPSTTKTEERLTVSQVIEGLLFVGGKPLPAKKIVDVLGGTSDHERIDEIIKQINELYSTENRPYVIQLIEGGYTMALVSKHEAVRRRVYGQGPKDVKLSQETLEVLAFVAYKQPVNRKDVEETGKKNAGGLLRQLLRRQLIELNRNAETHGESYYTTKRFLDLFGLASVDDLPQAIDFNLK